MPIGARYCCKRSFNDLGVEGEVEKLSIRVVGKDLREVLEVEWAEGTKIAPLV